MKSSTQLLPFGAVDVFNSLPSIEDASNSVSGVTNEQWAALAQVFDTANLSKSFKISLLHKHKSLEQDEVMLNTAEIAEQNLCISKSVKQSEIQSNPNIIPFTWKLNEDGVPIPLGFTVKSSDQYFEMADAEFLYSCRIFSSALLDLGLLDIFGISRRFSRNENLVAGKNVWVEDTNIETGENISELRDVTEKFTSSTACVGCGSFDRQLTPTNWIFVNNTLKCMQVCQECPHCKKHI